MKADVDVPDFPGYEFVRYGVPVAGDYVDLGAGDALRLVRDDTYSCRYLIYRKTATWRSATKQEIFEVMSGVAQHRLRIMVVGVWTDIKDVYAMNKYSASVTTHSTAPVLHHYGYHEVQIQDA